MKDRTSRRMSSKRQLTFRYLLAVSIIFVLSLSTLLTQEYVLDKQESYASIINISGRQRMLSQRTTMLLFHLGSMPASEREQQGTIRENLLQALDLMEKSHEVLITGKLEDGSSFILTPAVSSMYFEQPLNVDSKVRNHIDTIRKLLTEADTKEANTLFHNAVTTLLDSLNAVVQQYENESNRYSDLLKRIEWTVFTVTFLVLVAIIFLIFRPMVRSVVENEDALNSLLDHLPVYLDIVTKDGTILYQSKHLSKALGKATTGKKCFEVYKDDGRQCGSCPLLNPESRDGGNILVDNCLGGRTLQVTHVKIFFQGQAAILETFTDITEQRQTEQYLVQARDAAERANSLKSEFLASISHEIKTPINAISGLTYLSLETELTVKQRDYLNKISASTTQLMNLITDLLDFSQIETNGISLKPSPFNLHETMDNLASLVTYDALEKGLEINFNIEPDVPVFLMGDRYRLEQILKQLIGNAIKFTDSGYIDINTRCVYIEAGTASLYFTVHDTGTGVAAELTDHIFQPFSQGENSNIRKHGGAGMGLAICQKLITLMGGTIQLEEKNGPGSLFSFTLDFPIIAEQEQPLNADLRNKKVLIVDDHPMARKSLANMLSALHMEITAVASAEEALAVLEKANSRQKSYDFVTLDWQMKGMDGLEAGKIIKESPGKYGTPAMILVTAFSKAESVQQAEQDFVGLLLKPVNRAVLVGTLLEAQKDQPLISLPIKTGGNQKLPRVLPGLDIEKGLAQAGGNKRIYHGILQKFSRNQSSQARDIRQAVEERDTEKAHRLIHTLKGVSANIGATCLQGAAGDLEQECGQNTVVDSESFVQKLGVLENALLEVLHSINSLQSTSAAEKEGVSEVSELTDANRLAALPLLDTLIALLEESDTEAEQYLDQLKACLNTAPLQEKLKRLGEKVGQYEFDKAADLGKLIRRELNG